MNQRDRWKPAFMVVWMTVTMGTLGLLVRWALETDRIWIPWCLSLALAFIIGKFWDYKPPPD